MPRKEGKFLIEDFYDLTGGLNTADSPFNRGDNQASGGQNFDYTLRGAFKKRAGSAKLNSTADTQLLSLGLSLWDKPGSAREVIRYAGRKIQNFDANASTFTDIYEDSALSSGTTVTITIASPGVVTFTAHGLAPTDPVVFTTTGALPTGITAGTTYYVKTVLTSNTFTITATPNGSVINTSGSQSGIQTAKTFNTLFLASSTTIPVVTSMFNTATAGVLWSAGGGQTRVYGVYSDTKATENGVIPPSGTLSTSVGAGGGAFAGTGTYWYAVSLRKASTQAEGNATLDISAAVANVTDQVTVSFAALSAVDTTKYDRLIVWRSAVNGVTGFTTGSRVAEINIASGVPASYVDSGSQLLSSQNIPRADSTILDNSPLPSGTYSSIASWKRRLAVAKNSTVYLSDLNKPESWPTTNTITVPSGGDITGLAVISFTTQFSSAQDEILCVFKQRELWIITGSTLTDWSLKFVDNSGCPNQPLAVAANGYLVWVAYRGIYLWNGSDKPVYISQKIEDKFQSDGDLRKDLFMQGFGIFAQARNEIQWYLSSSDVGEQKYVLKLDLRLTQGSEDNSLAERKIQGIFTQDTFAYPIYAGMSFLPGPSATQELLYAGDNAGYLYTTYTASTSDAGEDIAWEYLTPNIECGQIGVAKRYEKVLVYVLDNGVYNIDLDYWVDYAYTDDDASTQAQAVSSNFEGAGLVWNVGDWDENYWDTSSLRIKPLVFNLTSSNRGNEGDAIALRFRQTGSAESPIIYGFSLFYSEISVRK